MKVNEVPQDDANMLEGKTREIQYAVDENGKYRAVKSVGWSAKNEIMQQAWEFMHEEIEEAHQWVKEGKKSPVFYYMKKNLMDVKTLSDYMGLWRFQIKRHFNPKTFNKLSAATLNKYVRVFNLKDIQQLKNIPGE